MQNSNAYINYMRSDNIQFFLQKATFKFLKEKKTREKGGEGVLRRSKIRQHLPKIQALNKFGQLFGGDRPTYRPTYRQTDRPTDRQTDIVVHREVALSKNKNCTLHNGSVNISEKQLSYFIFCIDFVIDQFCFSQFVLSCIYVRGDVQK